MQTFASRLKDAREKAGFTSAQSFANVLGQEPHTYRHWERGETEPDFENLTRICELLNVSPNDLLPAPRPDARRTRRGARARRDTPGSPVK